MAFDSLAPRLLYSLLVGEVRSWFLRDILALVERERGAGATAFVAAAFPDRVRTSCAKQALQNSGPTDTVAVADAEEFLSAVDAKLGDGTGRFLEELGTELTARTLSQNGSTVIVGDLYGTLARLSVPFEHPFPGLQIKYVVARTPAGLSLEVGARGHPRLTRILRHLATGTVHAAQRFARVQAPQFRVYGETRGEIARIDVLLFSDSSPPNAAPTDSEPPRRSTRPVLPVRQSSLSEEVDAIFSRRSPQRAPGARHASPTGYSVQEAAEEELEAPAVTRRPGRNPSAPAAATDAGERHSDTSRRATPEHTTVRPAVKSGAPPEAQEAQEDAEGRRIARRRTKPYGA